MATGEYDSRHRGLSIDDTISSAMITVNDLTELANIDVTNNRVTIGKRVCVLDNGFGKRQLYCWNGSTWSITYNDIITMSNGGVIKTTNEEVIMTFVSEGDDAGLNISGEVSVGSAGNGKELIGGEGDSYPVNIAFHCTIGDTAGNTIVNATNVTDILKSDTGSSVGLFGGVASGNYILIGSDYQFGGVKVKYDVLNEVDPSDVIGEYLNSSDVWAQQSFMATNADFPYQQTAQHISNYEKEHWFFGFTLIDYPNPLLWQKQILTINGIAYEKYWARLRLTSTISAEPVVEQLKQHSNRTEINPNGSVHYFGTARRIVTLQAGLENLIPTNANTPANTNIGYWNGFELVYTRNQFNNNSISEVALVQNYLDSLDTSVSLKLQVSYYLPNSADGDIEFEFSYKQVQDGFIYGNSDAPDGTVAHIETITGNTGNQERHSFEVLIPISDIPEQGGGVVISIKRDATNANADDTLAGAIVLTNVVLDGVFWR